MMTGQRSANELGLDIRLMRPGDRNGLTQLTEDVAPERVDAVLQELPAGRTDCHLTPTHVWVAQSGSEIVAAIAVTMGVGRVAIVHDLTVTPAWAATVLPILMITAALEDGRARGGTRAGMDQEIAAVAGLCILVDDVFRSRAGREPSLGRSLLEHADFCGAATDEVMYSA